MSSTNPIYELRKFRQKHRRAPLNMATKNRKKRRDFFISYASSAGQMILKFLTRIRPGMAEAIRNDERQARSMARIIGRRRRAPGQSFLVAGSNSREATRRRRQGVFAAQHPSVVARFANHPTRAQVEAAAAQVGA